MDAYDIVVIETYLTLNRKRFRNRIRLRSFRFRCNVLSFELCTFITFRTKLLLALNSLNIYWIGKLVLSRRCALWEGRNDQWKDVYRHFEKTKGTNHPKYYVHTNWNTIPKPLSSRFIYESNTAIAIFLAYCLFNQVSDT